MPGKVVWQASHETPWPFAKTGIARAFAGVRRSRNADAQSARSAAEADGRKGTS